MEDTADTDTCEICAEKFNLTTRHIIPCEYCPFAACQKCTATYLLTQPTPHCMNPECNRAWTRKHMTKHLSPTFRNREFKQHTENILYDKERAFFQDTQLEIEDDNRQAKLIEKLQELDRERREEFNRIRIEYEMKTNEVRREMNMSYKSTERAKFVQRCIYDNCQGFMSTQWKCGLCERHACSKCHKPKVSHEDLEHVCDPNDVASVEAIKRETKPCPKCHTQIYKIHGCDQMWCTNCRTPFSWVHGTIIHGPLHNPHYHEYLATRNEHARNDPRNEHTRNDPRNEMNERMECGITVPDYLPFAYRAKIENSLSDEKYAQHKKNLFDLCRNINHVAYEEVNNYQIPANELNINHKDRKSFLLNNINEPAFKRIILKNYKETQKNVEMRQIMEMVRDALITIYARMADYLRQSNRPTETEELLRFSEEIDGVREYANNCVADINTAYQSMSRKRFSQSFYFMVGDEERQHGR